MESIFPQELVQAIEWAIREGNIPPEEIVRLNDDILGDMRQAQVQAIIGGELRPDFALALERKILDLHQRYFEWIEAIQSEAAPVF